MRIYVRSPRKEDPLKVIMFLTVDGLSGTFWLSTEFSKGAAPGLHLIQPRKRVVTLGANTLHCRFGRSIQLRHRAGLSASFHAAQSPDHSTTLVITAS